MTRQVKEASAICEFIKQQLLKDQSLEGQLSAVPRNIVIEPLPRGGVNGSVNWYANPISGTPEMLLAFQKAVEEAQQKYDLDVPPLGGLTFF